VDGFDKSEESFIELAFAPEQAITLAKSAIQTSNPHTIFLVDQKLGAGMDGIDVMKELLTICPDSDAVIFTGFDNSEDGIRAYDAGASRYLSKTAEPRELIFVLNDLARSRREKVENKWRVIFSEMMETALHYNEFNDVAKVVVEYSIQLGFKRAHLFWAPKQSASENQRNVFVGIECAGDGCIPLFSEIRFNLPEKKTLNGYLRSRDAVFISENEAIGDVMEEMKSIGYPYPSGGLWILPLWSGQELLGALTLDFGKARSYLGKHQHALLNFFARQVAVTLEHSGLYNKEKRTSGEMKLLQRASVEMLRIANLSEDAFWLTVLTVATANFGLGFNRALLFLMNDNQSTLVGRAGVGDNNSEDAMQGWKQDEERKYNLNSFIKDALEKRIHLTPLNAFIKTREVAIEEFGADIRAAIENRQTIELSEKEAFAQIPASITSGLHPSACAILPIQAGSIMQGLVIVDNKHNHKPLNKNSLENLQTLLANAGLVWETLRQRARSEDLRARSEDLLDANYEILGGAGHQPLHETLDLICKTARTFSQANWAIIYPIRKIDTPPFYAFEFEQLGCDGKLTTHIDISKEQPNVGGVSMHVLHKGELIVKDMGRDCPMLGESRLSEHQFVQREEVKALIGIAIQEPVTRDTLGILYLDYLQPHEFSKIEIRHANSFAHLAAVAISNARRLDERRQRGLLKAAHGISETVGAELNIEEVMEKILKELKILFQNTSLCVLLYDENENALKFAPRTLDYYEIENPNFQNIRVFPLEEKEQASISIACKVAKKALATRRPEHLHVPNVKDDPDYLPLNPKTTSELCISLMDRSGNLLGILALEREKNIFDDEDDIAFVQMAAQQLGQAIERSQQSEQLAFKSTVATMTAWASDIAHEINSEVGYIRGHAYLLKQTISDLEHLRYINEIDESAKNLSSVGPWSEQARKEIPLDISLRRYLESIVSQRNVDLALNLQTPDAYIKVNPNELQQVLRHLVRNSARAMESNQETKEKKISVSTRHLADGRVEILFQDYGPGIKDEIRAAIFQRRTSTKAAGGYGLLLTRQLVEDIGGKINLLPSAPDKGAVFSIKLPILSKTLDVE
jgi:signal transduction histidine kinase/ActR/RegA family two-component response regulator